MEHNLLRPWNIPQVSMPLAAAGTPAMPKRTPLVPRPLLQQVPTAVNSMLVQSTVQANTSM